MIHVEILEDGSALKTWSYSYPDGFECCSSFVMSAEQVQAELGASCLNRQGDERCQMCLNCAVHAAHKTN